jgi:hypothetical protein
MDKIDGTGQINKERGMDFPGIYPMEISRLPPSYSEPNQGPMRENNNPSQ